MTMLYARYPKTMKKNINETDPEDALRALTVVSSMLDYDPQSVSTMYSVENL